MSAPCAAVRRSERLSLADGQSPHLDPLSASTARILLNREPFGGIVARATAYAAEPPTYATTHARIRRDRGPASARACWRCGRRARVWSCIAPHGDRVRGVSGSGAPAWYSLDPDDYRPACSRCAALDDREHADARRAVAHLALSPIPRRERSTPPPAPTAPPEPESLFAPDPTDPTRWSLA